MADDARRATRRSCCGRPRCSPAWRPSRSSTRSALPHGGTSGGARGRRAGRALAVPDLLLGRGARLRADDRASCCSRRSRCCSRSTSGGRRWWVVYAAACVRGRLHATTRACSRSPACRCGCSGRTRRRAAPRCWPTRRRWSRFLPWLAGLRGDMDSPTTDILSRAPAVHRQLRAQRRSRTGRSATPTRCPGRASRDLPGVPALVALALALAARAGAGSRARRAARAARRAGPPASCSCSCWPPPSRSGEALASAVGSNLFGTRNLAAVVARASRSASRRCCSRAGPRLGRRRRRAGDRRPSRRRGSRCSTPTSSGPTTSASRPTSSARRSPGTSSIDGGEHQSRRRADARSTSTLGGPPHGPPARAQRRCATTRSGSSALAPPTADVVAARGGGGPRAPAAPGPRDALAAFAGADVDALPAGLPARRVAQRFPASDPTLLVVYEDQTATGA